MQGKVLNAKKTQFRAISGGLAHADSAGAELLFLFNHNDRDAFTKVYKKFFLRVFYYAKTFVNDAEAEDVTAEAFTKLWKMEKSFASLQSVKNFLQITVRNSCFNIFRHDEVIEKNKHALADKPAEIMFNMKEDDAIEYAQVKRILATIEDLSPLRKKIFELFYFGGLREKEIALKLNIGKGTVHNQKLIAVKQIRLAVLQFNFLIGIYMFLR